MPAKKIASIVLDLWMSFGTSASYHVVSAWSLRLKNSKKTFLVGSSPCTSSYVRTGASVIAVKSEIEIEAAMVSANCWNSSPVVPGRNATGMKTDISTSDVAMTGPVISAMARFVASKLLTLSSTMWRTMFSKTTMASSTTKPVASVNPKSVSVLMLKLSSFISMNVPISDTGIVIVGIRTLCQFCRNRKMTMMTSRIAISSVTTTSLIEALTKSDVSKAIV